MSELEVLYYIVFGVISLALLWAAALSIASFMDSRMGR
jgi:hypothetical protein